MTTIRVALGIVFLILAVAGAILPILQGWLFALLAALMFFPNNRYACSAVEKIQARWPRAGRFLKRMGIGTGTDAA